MIIVESHDIPRILPKSYMTDPLEVVEENSQVKNDSGKFVKNLRNF